MNEQKLDKIITEEISKLNESCQQWEIKLGRNPLLEMSKINKKDTNRPFPFNSYNIYVQGENSPHKPPHIHVVSKQEGYNIRVYIANGELMSVDKYGTRDRTDSFNDVIGMIKEWFQLPSSIPIFQGKTNQEVAESEWDLNN